MKLDETSTRSIPAQQQDITSVRQRLKRRLETHGRILYEEIERLTAAAAELGAQRVILFGSLVEERAWVDDRSGPAHRLGQSPPFYRADCGSLSSPSTPSRC